MVYEVSVIYPKDDSSKFDMDYYLKTHMPLVAKSWASSGLKSYRVIQYNPHVADGSAPPFSVKCDLTFDSADSLKKAVTGPEAKEVFGDVPNFSNRDPLFNAGDIMTEVKV